MISNKFYKCKNWLLNSQNFEIIGNTDKLMYHLQYKRVTEFSLNQDTYFVVNV